MKKSILSIALLAIICLSTNAQNIQESRANFNESSVPAYTLTLNRDADFVKAALKDRMERISGLKSKSVKGFVSYPEQFFGEISTSPINIYTAVEETGKKSNKQTIVTMFVLTPELKIIENEEVNVKIQQFLTDFNQYLTKYEAYQKMNEEMDKLKKAQKEQASLVSEKNDVEKDITSKIAKIDSKKKDIDSYNEKIKKSKEEITKLEAEIKNAENQKTKLESEIEKANVNVERIQGEVEKYRKLSE